MFVADYGLTRNIQVVIGMSINDVEGSLSIRSTTTDSYIIDTAGLFEQSKGGLRCAAWNSTTCQHTGEIKEPSGHGRLFYKRHDRDLAVIPGE